ncbi:MAG TPA: peptidyl-prolyl cis-trans isomerase [Thermoanaerobaculia bacterium]|nr:peptidyl-prolyl cis-trans isomerase [Thermoanaerobaculia bacterium]
MKRCLIILAVAALAVPLFAQQAATPLAKNVVAVVNGESITAEQLDLLWDRIGAKMRAQYEKTGNGKFRFLENYVSKRLLIQLATEADFDKSPAVQAELEAAKEAALFDLYVRDVVASQIVTEEMMRKFYADHAAEFGHPETAKVRLIQVSKEKHSVEEARLLLSDILKNLFTVRMSSGNNHQVLSDAFAAAAKKSSEHASAAAGGDLGWITREGLDPAIREGVFTMQPGSMSGILESGTGLSLVLVEDRAPAWTESYESARAGIREYLLGTNSQKVVEAVSRATRELRASSKVTLYPDNLK